MGYGPINKGSINYTRVAQLAKLDRGWKRAVFSPHLWEKLAEETGEGLNKCASSRLVGCFGVAREAPERETIGHSPGGVLNLGVLSYTHISDPGWEGERSLSDIYNGALARCAA